MSGWGDYAFVNLPIFMPNGAPATVRIRMVADGFEVDDAGYAYRELEAVGADRSFPRVAAKVAKAEELDTDRRRIFVTVPNAELTRAICDVGLASRNVVAEVFSRLVDEDVAEVESYLQERLVAVFGKTKVITDEDITGASAKSWGVSAIVHAEFGSCCFPGGCKPRQFHQQSKHSVS